MDESTLYLAGKKINGEVLLSHQSHAVVFLLAYCQLDSVQVVLVDRIQDTAQMRRSCLDFLKNHVFSSESDIPEFVQSCDFPAVFDAQNGMIRSGLCGTFRHIVAMAHNSDASLKLKDLLGFREGSLRACAEVSSWTKLCEIDIPKCVVKLIEKIRSLKGKSTVPLPLDVMKLEAHLRLPAKMSNKTKKKQWIISRLRKTINSDQSSRDSSDRDTQSLHFTGGEIPISHGVVRFKISKTVHETTIPRIQPDYIHDVGFPLKQHDDIDESNNLRVQKRTNHDFQEKSVNSNCINVIPSPSVVVFENERVHDDPVSNLESAMKDIHLDDITIEHVYVEGIEMTIADLVLYPFLHHLMNVHSSAIGSLSQSIPNVLEWMKHMTSLIKVQQAATTVGMSSILSQGDNSCHLKDIQFTLPDSSENILGSEEDELCRWSKSKYKALKPEVIISLQKVKDAGITPLLGPHPRGLNVQLDWESLPPAAHPNELPAKRIARKREQLENLVTAVQAIAQPHQQIVDFCSGGGHLGIILAYLLPDCMIYLVENKEASLLRAKKKIEQLQLKNIFIYHCNLDYFHGVFDIGVCLHACGVATDLVQQQCLDNNAAFVICPCCYGSIQETHLITYPRSRYFQDKDITREDVLTIGHAADQTELNIALEEQGKFCMDLIDTDRASLAQEQGYQVALTRLHPTTCTTKNNLLIGLPGKKTTSDASGQGSKS